MSDAPPAAAPAPRAEDDPPVRSFVLRRTNTAPDPVVPFDVDGVIYHLHPTVNGLVVMDLAALATLRIGQDSQPMWEFFEGCLQEEYPQFRRHIRGPTVDIEAEGFKALVMWMMEQVTEHPTVRSSS